MVDPKDRRKGREIQRTIGEILFRDWDPIGVADDEEALGEYNAYVGGVYRLLASDASANEIAAHLARVEAEAIGFPDTDPITLVPVAEKLIVTYRKLVESAVAKDSADE